MPVEIPGIFSRIDALSKEFFRETECIEAIYGDKLTRVEGFHKVKSQPFTFKGLPVEIQISGDMDELFLNEDGHYVIVDLKTMDPKEDKIKKYGSQLNCYVLAMEMPDDPAGVMKALKTEFPPHIEDVLVFAWNPASQASPSYGPKMSLKGNWSAHRLEIDRDGMFKELRRVAELYLGPVPDLNPRCTKCKFFSAAMAHDEGKAMGETPRDERRASSPEASKSEVKAVKRTGPVVIQGGFKKPS